MPADLDVSGTRSNVPCWGTTTWSITGEPLIEHASMGQTLVGAGIACIIAAIIGGGLKAFGLEIPVLNSLRRQVLLAIFGAILLGIALFDHSTDLPPGPKSPEKTVELNPASSVPAPAVEEVSMDLSTKPEPKILDEPPAITEERENRLPRNYLDSDERHKVNNLESLTPDERNAFGHKVHNKSIAISGLLSMGANLSTNDLSNVSMFGWHDNIHPKSVDLQFWGDKYRQRFLLSSEEVITAICFIDDIDVMRLFDCQIVNP
jgi:hypothetical protein